MFQRFAFFNFRVPENLSPFAEDVAITEASVGHVYRVAKSLAEVGDALPEFVIAELACWRV